MQDLSEIKPKISEEEQAELRDFVQNIVNIGYEKFEELKPELKGYAKKIMRFFTLPKTPLHQSYLDILAEPKKRLKEQSEEEKIKGKMKEGKARFIEEHFIEEFHRTDVKYKIIGRKTLRHTRTWELEDMLHIAIPYSATWSTKNKFWFWIQVSNLKTPKLFEEFIEKIPRYTWNTDLISNKE